MERMPARRLSAARIASARGDSLDDGLSSPRAGAVSCPPLNSVRGSMVDVDFLQAARRRRLVAAAPDFCSWSILLTFKLFRPGQLPGQLEGSRSGWLRK